MKKKILLILLVLAIIFITFIIVAYLNKPLILRKVKTVFLEQIQSYTGRTAAIGKIDYNFLKGVIINDLEITGKSTDDKATFLLIKELAFNPVIFPFILKKNILIPSINISGLDADIVRLKDGDWNFSDIVKTFSSKPQTKSNFSFTVLKLNITNSEILFQDNYLASPFSRKLKDINLTLKPYLPTGAKFDLKVNIEDADSKVALSGKINFLSKQASAVINLDNLLIHEYLAYFGDIPFDIKDGKLSAKLACDYNNELLHLEGSSSIDGINVTQDNLEIQSDSSSTLKIDYDFKNQEKPLNYEALIDISNAKASGVPYLKEINELNGKLKLSLDKLIFDETSGQSLWGPLTLSGSLYNFQNPELDVKINSNIDLTKLKEIFSLKDMKLEGNSDTELTVKGPLSSPENLDFKGRANISKAKFNTSYLPEAINGIQSTIDFDKNKISWKDLKANFQQETYTSSGSMENFLKPYVKLALSSNKLNLESEFGITNKTVNIAKLAGTFFNSKFDIKGDVNISNTNNPLLDLVCNGNIDLADLGNINKNIKDALDKIKLSGIVNTQATLNGGLKDYTNWKLSLNGTSKAISIYGLKINNANLNYSQVNSPIANVELVGNPYTGELSIKNQVDLSKADLPFVIKIDLNGVDISLLKNDTPLKDKEISGKFFGNASLKGSYNDIKNSLNGFGNIHIEEGNLWQLEMLKGLGQFLLIPEFQKINFKEAEGDFVIENNKVSTEDFLLSSDPLNMLLEGYIDFGGNIDFKVTAQVAEGLIKSPTDLQGIFTSILSQSTNAITIKLTGSVKNPKYKIIPIPGQIFKKAKDFIFEEILP